MNLVSRVLKFCKEKVTPLAIATAILGGATTLPKQIRAQDYDNKFSVVAGSHTNNNLDITILQSTLGFYQLTKLKNITDDNIKLTAFINPLTFYTRGDQTSQWNLDDDWVDKDLFVFPTQITFDATDNDISAKMVLDNIVDFPSGNNDLLLTYIMGHGSGSATPGDGKIQVATKAGASSWNGLPMDEGILHHYHFNKALELADYRLAVLILDGCNNESITKDLDYTQGMVSNPLQKNVIAIASAGVDEVYSGTPFGHYLLHLFRKTDLSIKAAVDSAGSLKNLHSNIKYFGPNKTELEAWANTHSLFDYLSDADLGIDNVPPTISSNSPTSLINLRRPSIQAQITDNLNELNLASIVMNINGTDYLTSNPQLSFSNGILTFIPSSDLSDNTYNIQVTVKDQDDNQAILPWSFRIDATKPFVSITSPIQGFESQNPSLVIRYSVTELNPNYTQVQLDNQSWTNINSDTLLLSALSRTQHTLRIKSVDQALNEGLDSLVFTILQDTTKPNISDLQPSSIGFLSNNQPDISAKIEDVQGIDTTSINLSFNSTNYDLQNPQLTFLNDILTLALSTPLADGDYIVNLQVQNNLGNQSSEQWTFSIDATKPLVSITNYTFLDSTKNSARINYTVTEANPNRLESKLGNNPWTPVPTMPVEVSGLNIGNQTFYIKAIDQANNEGIDSTTISVPVSARKYRKFKPEGYSLSMKNNSLMYSVPEQSELSLYNTKGRLIATKKVDGKGFLSVDLPAGNYICRIKNKDKEFSNRIVKLR